MVAGRACVPIRLLFGAGPAPERAVAQGVDCAHVLGGTRETGVGEQLECAQRPFAVEREVLGEGAGVERFEQADQAPAQRRGEVLAVAHGRAAPHGVLQHVVGARARAPGRVDERADVLPAQFGEERLDDRVGVLAKRDVRAGGRIGSIGRVGAASVDTASVGAACRRRPSVRLRCVRFWRLCCHGRPFCLACPMGAMVCDGPFPARPESRTAIVHFRPNWLSKFELTTSRGDIERIGRPPGCRLLAPICP